MNYIFIDNGIHSPVINCLKAQIIRHRKTYLVVTIIAKAKIFIKVTIIIKIGAIPPFIKENYI